MPDERSELANMHPNQAQRVRELLNSSTIWWIGLAIALIVLALLLQWLRSWYQGGADDADAREEIARQIEEMYRRGDLTEEEFRSIKSRSAQDRAVEKVHRSGTGSSPGIGPGDSH